MQADLSGNLHLLWRAGFGPAVEDVPLVNRLDKKALYQQLVKRSSAKPEFINVASGTLDGLVKGLQTEGKMQELSKEQRAQIRKESREALKNLNLRWLDEMVHSGAQLREKMAFFWHGHFACREINVYFQQQLLDVIRTHALSDFRTLLREVSKSAAMLAFLNNQQNRKKQPNENFAREVMELFTLGRGNYTEQDIKEAARAFTGWGFDLSGQFVFRKQFHDGGLKTIFGQTGYFDGDDVINMLLDNEQTARYITTKLYRFMVNEQADEKIVTQLAGSFYKSGYDISKLLEQIFLSEWFYDKNNIGVKIKSPVELIVGVRRMLPMEFQNEEAILLYQRLLGQILFYPPNVAGWPGGRNWIDSSSLMYRLRLPRILKDDENIGLKPKDDDDVMMGMSDQGRRQVASRNVMVNINWPMYSSLYEKVSREKLGISIAATLLQTGRIDLDLLNAHADQRDRESYIRTFTVQVMSLPEYQLM
jgi:uncharacterized protein (DUF1800 family)